MYMYIAYQLKSEVLDSIQVRVANDIEWTM